MEKEKCTESDILAVDNNKGISSLEHGDSENQLAKPLQPK